MDELGPDVGDLVGLDISESIVSGTYEAGGVVVVVGKDERDIVLGSAGSLT